MSDRSHAIVKIFRCHFCIRPIVHDPYSAVTNAEQKKRKILNKRIWTTTKKWSYLKMTGKQSNFKLLLRFSYRYVHMKPLHGMAWYVTPTLSLGFHTTIEVFQIRYCKMSYLKGHQSYRKLHSEPNSFLVDRSFMIWFRSTLT